MMRALATAGGIALGLVLTIASLPWAFWAMGRAMCGDDEGAGRVMHASPIELWWDWLDARK